MEIKINRTSQIKFVKKNYRAFKKYVEALNYLK